MAEEQKRLEQTKYSFGTTSAIITNLGLITGLDTLTSPKMSIIGSILVIALVDNISDSLGIHVYQESECITEREVWFSTITNFLARLLVSATFVFLIALLPIKIAVLSSVCWGIFLLSILSYAIAKKRGLSPYQAMLEHIGIATVVIMVSHFLGEYLIRRF